MRNNTKNSMETKNETCKFIVRFNVLYVSLNTQAVASHVYRLALPFVYINETFDFYR